VDPFLYSISLTVHPQREPAAVLIALDGEISKLQERLVAPAEIRRAIKQARANFVYGSENITNQAFWLGYAEMFAHYGWFESYLANMSRITATEVRRVAREYLRPQSRVVGTYVPLGKRAVA
jgi:zinc protease